MLSNSFFRVSLHQIFLEKFDWSPFNLFPLLKFTAITDEGLGSGRVEILEELSAVPSLTEKEVVQIGAVIGLCAWLGLSDLHEDNFSYGRTQTGKLICAPLDIECIFNDYSLPSQTHIISTKTAIESAGLTKLNIENAAENSTNFLACIIHGYFETLSFLEMNRKTVAKYFTKNKECYDWPVRVILRNTKKYLNAENSSFIDAELEQLSRGDIPYFFRTGKSLNYYYLSGKSDLQEKIKVLDNTLKMSIHTRLLCNDKFVDRIHFENLISNGTLQMLRFFSRGLKNQIGKFKETRIEVSDDRIYFTPGEHHRGFLCKR